MDVEFLPEQPDDSGALPDVPEPPSRRRHALILNGLLAAVLVAGGIGWFVSRPAVSPKPAPAPTAPAVVAVPPTGDELYGCPDTLACDDNHQSQQHWIDLIKQAMQHRTVAVPATHTAPLTHAVRLGGLGRIFLVP